MKNTYVVVADLSHANVFALEWLESMGTDKPSKLVPVTELQHEERRLRSSDVFSDSRPGLQSATGGGQHPHGVDDGRDAERAERDRRFAKEIVDTIREVVNDEKATLILAAGPKLLGFLRKETAGWRDDSDLEVHELSKRLVQLSSIELHDYLAKQKLLPERVRAY